MPRDWAEFENQNPCVSDFYGSSPAFYRDLRLDAPWLLVPESEIVMIESPGWDNTRERRPKRGEPCSLCGGRVDEGSVLYCPDCQQSGFEAQLQAQRAKAGQPPMSPPEERHDYVPTPPKYQGPARPRKMTRRERRAHQHEQAA